MSSVDAIVVPAARPGRRFPELVRLADALGSTLVVLCSGKISAQDVVEEVGLPQVNVVAIDFDKELSPPARDTFATSELLLATPFRQRGDVSAKRNTALLLARHAGWGRVFFLDDDIAVEEPDHVRTASALLADYAVTGLTIDGFPDGSVAAHAYRALGRSTKSFIGAGALMVAPEKRRSFFPEIYNDEWLYMLDDMSFPALALTGSAVQDDYDPFGDPARAVQEEFGEVIALGLHFCIEGGLTPRDADRAYWRGFLPTRRHLLEYLLGEYQEQEGAERIVAAIHAALDTFALITPALCAAYVDAWLRDREWWSRHLDGLSSDMPIKEAVTELGLPALLIS